MAPLVPEKESPGIACHSPNSGRRVTSEVHTVALPGQISGERLMITPGAHGDTAGIATRGCSQTTLRRLLPLSAGGSRWTAARRRRSRSHVGRAGHTATVPSRRDLTPSDAPQRTSWAPLPWARSPPSHGPEAATGRYAADTAPAEHREPHWRTQDWSTCPPVRRRDDHGRRPRARRPQPTYAASSPRDRAGSGTCALHLRQ
jgi:hypothetical protein